MVAISTETDRGSLDPPFDDVLDELLRRFGSDAHAKTVFGDPVEHDGVGIIPVARVGWGFGTGRRGDKRSSSKGLGAGMGVSPAGYIEITGAGARFRPIRPWWVELAYVVGGGIFAFLFLRWRRVR